MPTLRPMSSHLVNVSASLDVSNRGSTIEESFWTVSLFTKEARSHLDLY